MTRKTEIRLYRALAVSGAVASVVMAVNLLVENEPTLTLTLGVLAFLCVYASYVIRKKV